MNYYSSHKLASKGRAEFVRNAFNKWNKQPLWKKGIDASAVVTAIALTVNLLLPDMHKELEEWNPNYQNACYTHDADADGLDARNAYDYMQSLYHILDAAGFSGAHSIADYESYLSNHVVCVGPAYEDEDISRWFLTGVTIINENYTPLSYAFNLTSEEFSDFWHGNVTDMEERLVYHDALLYSRFERAVEATEIIDMFYRMAYAAMNADAFNSPEWQDVLANPLYAQAATAYQDGILADTARYNLDYPIDPSRHATNPEVMRATFHAFMMDGQALNDGDIEFMRRYYPRLEDQDETCTGSGDNRVCITYDVAPPSWVHSRRINGEIIAQMSDFTHGQDSGWLDPLNIEDMMRDERYTRLYSDDATSYDERISRRINWYQTERHDTHRPITTDYLYEGWDINNYNQEAASTPRPLPKRYNNNMN